MAMHRFYVPQKLALDERVALPAPIARQCFRVLKLHAGERIALLDGTGLEACVTLLGVSADGVEGIIESCDMPPVEPPEPLELIASMPRQEKWEWILQKGTELGVTSFQPIESRRCVVRVSPGDWPKKADRWQKIIVEAVEQSGRTRIPELRPPITLQNVVKSLPAGIVLHTGAGLPRLQEVLLGRPALPEGRGVRLLIGPEGGLEVSEVELLLAAEWEGATLGPRILRCETAAAAACAIVMGSQ